MLITSNDTFKQLLIKIGATVVEPVSSELLVPTESAIMENLNTYKSLISQIDSGLFVAPQYKNKRVPFNHLYGGTNASIVAAWRGVKNSARIVFVGQPKLIEWMGGDDENKKSLSIKIMYDLINWFGM